MKPANWRTYYWYRPPSLARPPMTADEIKRQAADYCDWLAAERGFSRDDAAAHVAAMRRKKCAHSCAFLLPDPTGVL